MTIPRIKIISDGTGTSTKVMTEDGKDISGSFEAAELSIKVGEPNKAVLHAVLVEGEISAEVQEMRERLVPPPPPQPRLHVVIAAPDRRGYCSMQIDYEQPADGAEYTFKQQLLQARVKVNEELLRPPCAFYLTGSESLATLLRLQR